MEVDSWRPTRYGMRFRVNETFHKYVPMLPLGYIRGRADENGFIRTVCVCVCVCVVG
jgi:hypothetical protein